MILPAVLLLFRVVLGILSFYLICVLYEVLYEVMNCLSRSVENCDGILIGIVLNLQIAFGRMGIFTILIVPIYEH